MEGCGVNGQKNVGGKYGENCEMANKKWGKNKMEGQIKKLWYIY
jgi:hypothetical protein